MFRLFKKKKKIGCPVCYDSNTIGFGTDYLESKFDSRIEQSDKIGDVQTYRCSLCKSEFYKEGDIFQRFAKGQIKILEEFVNLDLELNEKLKGDLEKVGLTFDWKMNRQAPSKVILKNGEIFDFATVQVSSNPPIGYFYDHFVRIVFIDNVESIKPSEFGLLKEVREKTKDAEEMRMGFYPTVLKTKDGKKVVVNGQSLFFKTEEIKGADLELANEFWNQREKYIYEDKIENQILVIAKK
ncbi:MAG: hypothetical protein V2A54_06925 [Bacteroidota bacterium]